MGRILYSISLIVIISFLLGFFGGCGEEVSLDYVKEGSRYTTQGIKSKLGRGIDKSEKIEEIEGSGKSREYLQEILSEAHKELKPLSDASILIGNNLSKAENLKSDQKAIKLYKQTIDEAIVSLDFLPLLEAPLPKGFPYPSPPGYIRIKRYPELKLAEVSSKNLKSRDEMFQELFRHIKKKDIPMTTPVKMELEQEGGMMEMERMAFYYPEGIEISGNDNDNVTVKMAPPVTVVSVGRKGAYKRENFETGLEILNGWLDENIGQYDKTGKPRVLAYNSPFVLWFKKYSEVQIPVSEKKDKKKEK